MNVTDKRPKRLQQAVSSRMYALHQAPSRGECETRRRRLDVSTTEAA